MSNVRVLLDLVYLVFVDKALNIGALFNEPGSHEVDFACLQAHYDVEDDDHEEVCFVGSLTFSSVQVRHELIHVSVDQNQLKHRAGFVADVGELADLFAEVSLCSAVIAGLESWRLFPVGKQGLKSEFLCIGLLSRLAKLCKLRPSWRLLIGLFHLCLVYGLSDGDWIDFDRLLEPFTILAPDSVDGRHDFF